MARCFEFNIYLLPYKMHENESRLRPSYRRKQATPLLSTKAGYAPLIDESWLRPSQQRKLATPLSSTKAGYAPLINESWLRPSLHTQIFVQDSRIPMKHRA